MNPLSRLETALRSGMLWVAITKLLSEKERYGYELKEEIEKRFSWSPGKITPYVVLYRLEKEGFVESEKKDRKKFYRLTEKGKKLRKEGKTFLKSYLGTYF